MGLKRVIKKFLKYMIPTLLVLLIIPFSERNGNHGDSKDIFCGDVIRCVLKLEEKLSDGYQTGYCYEMVERLADYLEDSARTFLAEDEGFYLDSLKAGSLDILALPTKNIPDNEEFMALQLGDVPVSWVMMPDKRRQKEIIRWLNNFKWSKEYTDMISRFFHGYNPYRKGIRRNPSILSPYDELIKENAKKIGWNWKMLAALVWSESKFRIQACSRRGASGLMQMMPRTADRYDIEDLLNPRENIEAGAAYISRLQRKFSDTAVDEDELVKFTLAAYNAGEGRIHDCIELARSQGIDPGTWENLCLVRSRMSQDSILSVENVRHGRFLGDETVAYVKAVLNQYDIFNGHAPRFKVQPADTALVMIEETEDAERILLSPDSLGRIDLGDEQARNQEENHDDEPRDDVGGKHRR